MGLRRPLMQQSSMGGGLWDVTNWDEAAYRASLRAQREAATRTVYAARLGPSSHLLAAASSDGSVCLYSIAPSQLFVSSLTERPPVMEPVVSLSKHDGAAYDLQFYGEEDDTILLSCGDDGRIQGWHWQHIKEGALARSCDDMAWKPDFVLTNPQQKGPLGALASMPETNAIATSAQEGHIFSATGSGHAYCWDVETEKIVMTFEGHADYLHCICSRPSHKQVITGSEDGTVRIWDCRSGSTVAILDACKATRVPKAPKEKLPWVGCVALDASEKWLVCGSGGRCLTLWSLLSFDAVTRISTLSAPQAVSLGNNQIMSVGAQPYLSCFTYSGDMVSRVCVAPPSAFSLSAYPSGVRVVAGYGGLVDVISEFGSHITTFRCA